jgi:hypothetical protein
MKLIASDMVYVDKSDIPNAGRGVFAKRIIKKGENIESCPIIEVPKNDMSSLGESILVTYFFYFGRNKQRLAVALGFGSIYNHSYNPNATFKINLKDAIIHFVALNDIKKDEEITFNYYHESPKDMGLKNKSPLWFEE